MVVVYTPVISPRIQYVFKQVFENFLDADYRIVNVKPLDKSGQDFIVYYTHESGDCDLRIVPSGLLTEKTIQAQRPTVEVNAEKVKLFVNDSEHFGFDLFAAIFWMITRYEEYNDFIPDQHGRFPAKNSLAYEKSFILLPVVDMWLNDLAELINSKKIGLVPQQKFSIINTIDVDNAYAYKSKGFVRQLGALFKHFLKGQWKTLGERIKVLSGKKKDPFDTYHYIKTVASAKQVPTVFFHLVGELDQHDRNISVEHPAYVKLAGELKTWSVQGIHPSYRSNENPALVAAEKQKLEKAVGETITHSRQHFIKLRFPLTYRNLVSAGIQKDFSMGYADHAGFRAGTGRAFYFFDLEANKETSLLVQPFCIMEGTLRDYMQLSTEQSIEIITKIRTQLKALGSVYVAVWHNETLGDSHGWKGWRKVYEGQFDN